jgi:hypothetical protein
MEQRPGVSKLKLIAKGEDGVILYMFDGSMSPSTPSNCLSCRSSPLTAREDGRWDTIRGEDVKMEISLEGKRRSCPITRRLLHVPSTERQEQTLFR